MNDGLLLSFPLSVYITGKPNYKPEFSAKYKPIGYLFFLSACKCDRSVRLYIQSKVEHFKQLKTKQK